MGNWHLIAQKMGICPYLTFFSSAFPLEEKVAKRGVLFAARFGKRISRGSQGVGNSLLIPQRDKERPRGEGKGFSLPTRD